MAARRPPGGRGPADGEGAGAPRVPRPPCVRRPRRYAVVPRPERAPSTGTSTGTGTGTGYGYGYGYGYEHRVTAGQKPRAAAVASPPGPLRP